MSASYDLVAEIRRKTGLTSEAYRIDRTLRLAVDTRKSGQPYYDATLVLESDNLPPRIKDIAPFSEPGWDPIPRVQIPDKHPAIIGMGPAGLFCALAMVENGLKPRIYDRGDALEERASKVQSFWRDGCLDPNSNVQFGEGGAGAFSDGKLTSRSRSAETSHIIDQMIRFGAPEDIAFQALPHLGTDGIRAMVVSLRHHLMEQGCTFHYRSHLDDIRITSGKIAAISINGCWSDEHTVVLAPGNASRDTFRMLQKAGVMLEPKAFAIGFRIEQRQELINRAVFGKGDWERIMGPASYRLVDRNSGCYTFCMCPGGFVINASSEADSITTNGMSFHARDQEYCNSAVVYPISADQLGGVFAGVELQERIERQAFRTGYLAPAQDCGDFLHGKAGGADIVVSTRPGVYRGDISTLFPSPIPDKLKSALHKFGSILKGFHTASVLIAPETRTSSPIRIQREPGGLSALNVTGLYPAGEGSGYAGGIISSAVDGWKVGSGFRI